MASVLKLLLLSALFASQAVALGTESRIRNAQCMARYIAHRDAPLATLADTEASVINLSEYNVWEPDEHQPWQHQIKGSPDYVEDQEIGRKFLLQGKGQWDDTLLTSPLPGHVQLSELSFVYEHELVGKNGEFLKGWGRLMAVSTTQDFNTGEIGRGKYEWAHDNPIAPVLQSARERYYQALKKEGYQDAQIQDIRSRDESLPLVGSRYYVVAVDGKPKALLRIFGAKNAFTNPHQIAAGETAKPINSEFDRDRSLPINLEVGNAFADTRDGSGIRYANFWEFGWLSFIKRLSWQVQRPFVIHATSSGATVRLFSRLYKFPIVEPHPKPGYMHLQIDPQKFVEENDDRIMGSINEFRKKNGIKEPYKASYIYNYQ